LPHELAQQWFVALAKAVGYLHDHGIVHRDLKPANIFIENGLVKVGDYGLSKFMSGSQRAGQTQSVGTVHYMAPEISTGNYNKQIDIYASGVILYEMLTGRVPFDGESAGEILMKHLTSPPDLSKLPAEYVNIVGKALAKNPAHRYASLAEMAKVVESAGKDPQAAVLKPVAAAPAAAIPPQPAAPQPRRSVPVQNIPAVLPAPSLRAQIVELCGSLTMSAILAGVVTVLWAALGQGNFTRNLIGQEFFLTLACCWAVLIPAKFWINQRGDGWSRRVIMMVMGMCIGLGALWLDGWSLPWHTGPAELAMAGDLPANETSVSATGGAILENAAGYLSYFALAFFALRWWKLAERRRPHRFSFAPVLAAGFWGLALLLVWHEPLRGTLVLANTAVIIQLVSPWEQPPPALPRRVRLRYA
jgi:hypothetical protein